MKKIYIYIVALSTILIFSSCNDEWKDELYSHLIGFKAPINHEDVSRIYLRYQTDGEVTYKLPVIVSGSLKNNKNLDIQIAVDNDTLAILNEAKYTHRSDLYYKQLGESFYEFSSPICHIPSGSSKELFSINFKFGGLDLVEKWVLPLTVVDDPSYTMNMHKGWRKALLYINLFNDYSGRYSATGMNVHFDGDETKPTNTPTRELRVVDENSVFFYAGITEEMAEERGEYKIIAKFETPDEIEDEGSLLQDRKGKLTISAENSAINFEVLEQATYEIKEIMDKVEPFLKKRTVVVKMKYKYLDITSASVNLPYRCEGSMIIERKIDTRVPDEDQAIIW